MTVTTNYLVTGNGITGSTANSVQVLVSGGGIPIMPSGDPSGVTDTAAIAAAQAAAAAAGKCVVWGAGQYYVRATNQVDAAYQAIVLQSNVSHVGQPGAKVRLAASTQPSGWGGHVFFGSNVSNIRITGIEIDGNRTGFTSPAFAASQDGIAGSCVRLIDCTDITVDNCLVKSAIYHGLMAVDGCRRITFRHNKITDCGYRAMHYNGTDGAGNDITDAAFDWNECWENAKAADNTGNGGVFIALGSSYRISCQGNAIKGEPQAGIDIFGTGSGVTSVSREVLVAGNRINGAKWGIRCASGAVDIIITGNIISDSTQTGIELGAVSGVAVTNNTIRRTAGRAMLVGGSGDVTTGVSICGNRFIDNDGDTSNRSAIVVNTGAHQSLRINDNLFLNNGVTGASICSGVNFLGAGRAKSPQINGNTFRNNKGNAVLMLDTDDAQIYGNIMSDNFEASGPRGRAVWVRGSAANTLVMGNKATNDGVSNSLEQFVFDATVTNFRCYMNEAESGATNKFLASTGATGLAHSNIGTASWAVGVTTGSSAL